LLYLQASLEPLLQGVRRGAQSGLSPREAELSDAGFVRGRHGAAGAAARRTRCGERCNQTKATMTHRALRRALLCLAVIAVAVAGCSRVTIGYNSADFLVERYVRDYLDLEGTQIRDWEVVLEAGLARHRAEDLPYLARFFDTAHQAAEAGFDAARMDCLMDQFEDIYRRHMRLAVDVAAPLLARLTSDQVRHLDERFRAEEAEDAVDQGPAGAERRDRKRAERFGESIAWWIGPLSEIQEAVIREETAAIPDTADAWIGYRSAKREALVKMLEHGAFETEIRHFLAAWLIEYRDLPPALGRAHGQIRAQIARLFLRMDPTLTPDQRAHFSRRLASLRNDFLSLQTAPRMASVTCADAA